ncbi:hypothetical protein ACVF4U_00810 [Escherichia coli]|uniref:Uncharacterized protein n=1 Tax=Escherichia coli TaxID=562 RepID=A0AAW7V2F0_ECOLX|nr:MULTISPECIES: hypothetical protein [Enterobacteriaceae]USJ84440.1 hypothetical protein LXH19_00855 [Shigella sp. PIB]MBS9421941.1 hypothetical protein [Escherichia coli]MBT0590981.1 hypothetical protein [Escherichia coli]MBT0616859.1 hypothetical protein [Escherichia coli]MBT0643281.1 hypothetical protein [Escherichia coli]
MRNTVRKAGIISRRRRLLFQFAG